MRSAGPLSAAPPTIGEIATTEERRAASRSSMPGSARIGPIDTSGFDGAITTTSASVSAASVAAVGRGIVVEPDARHRDAVSEPDEVVLERDLLAGPGERDHGPEPIVRHREHRELEAPRARDLGRHRRQVGPLGEPGGPIEVRRQIAVAEVEPGRRGSRTVRAHGGVPFERLHRPPGLPLESPAALRIDRCRQRVRDRVEIR